MQELDDTPEHRLSAVVATGNATSLLRHDQVVTRRRGGRVRVPG